jgi:hypothetical protein
MSFFSAILNVLGFGNKGKFEIETSRDKDVLKAAYSEACKKLGKKHKGGKVRVRFVEGTKMSNLRPWKGEWHEVYKGVMIGSYSDRNKILTLYTTNNKFNFGAAIHEFAHAILYSHKIMDTDVQHDMIKKAGI